MQRMRGLPKDSALVGRHADLVLDGRACDIRNLKVDPHGLFNVEEHDSDDIPGRDGMAKKVPMRLRYLRMKSDSSPSGTRQAKSCEEELNALVTCWRVNGVDSAPCLSAVQALAFCSSMAVHSLRLLRLSLICVGGRASGKPEALHQLRAAKDVLQAEGALDLLAVINCVYFRRVRVHAIPLAAINCIYFRLMSVYMQNRPSLRRIAIR